MADPLYNIPTCLEGPGMPSMGSEVTFPSASRRGGHPLFLPAGAQPAETLPGKVLYYNTLFMLDKFQQGAISIGPQELPPRAPSSGWKGYSPPDPTRTGKALRLGQGPPEDAPSAVRSS